MGKTSETGPGQPDQQASTAPPPTPQVKRGRRLGSAENVKSALGHIFHEVEGDRMEIGKGRALTYIASQILAAINGSDLAERLAQLEEQLGGRTR